MTSTLKFWAAVAPSFLVVAGIALRAELQRLDSIAVPLEVRPVDPMDALSGRFIAAPLAIARLDVSELRNECPQVALGDSVWVALTPGEPWWRPSAVLCGPATGEVSLRGVLRAQHASLWTIDYGIERFYIPHEAADPSAPGSGPRPQIVALVRIDASGSGALVDLLVEGETYSDWNARQPQPDEEQR